MSTNKCTLSLLLLIMQSLCQAMNEEQKTEYHAARQMYENYGKPKKSEFKDKLLTVKIARDTSGTETTEIFARLQTLKTTVVGDPLDEASQNIVNQMQASMGLNRTQITFGSTIITQEPEEQLIQTIVKSVDGNETVTNH